jgi:hypothetical protein
MKKTLSFILIIILIVSLSGTATADEGGFHNFTYSGNYVPGQFYDVNTSDWFAPYVEAAFNFGFFRGRSESTFEPSGLLTLGEAVTLASRLRSIYYTGSDDFPASSPYYIAYANYALAHGIIDRHLNYTARATRAEFAKMVYNALPSGAYRVINSIPDYGITDVPSDVGYGSAVYTLYRAGILVGSDRFGTFLPHSNISRAEASTIMVRIADPALRLFTLLPTSMPAETIYQRNTDAVFMIETFRSDRQRLFHIRNRAGRHSPARTQLRIKRDHHIV